MFDETNKIAILGIANEGNDEKIAHQVRIKMKAGKEDEPEENAEPQIQATACGQATGEAVPAGAKMQPLALDPGEGGDYGGGYIPEGPDYETYICTSQWGYAYNCLLTTPRLATSTDSLSLPFVILPGQREASFVVWNYGGGTLRGTVTVSAPFSIVSGGSFSLAPGQPQQVIVRFAPITSGVFSQNIAITSNGGNRTVAISAQAITYEEYLQAAIQAYNTIAQNGVYTGLATWDQQRGRGLLVTGAPRLTREALQELEAQADTALDQPPLDPRIEGFFEEMSHVESAAQLNGWLSVLGEAIAQGRFDEEYQRLLSEGLQYVERAFMALLGYSSPDSAKLIIYEVVRRGWRAIELNQPYDGLEYLRKLRQLLEIRFSEAALAELLAQIASDLPIPVPFFGLPSLLLTINSILEQLGLSRCSSVSGCISRFMELAYQAALWMERNWGSAETDEFARSLFEIFQKFNEKYGFEDFWGRVFSLLDWMNVGERERYERGFSIVVAAARTIRGIASPHGWQANLVGIIRKEYPYGIWYGVTIVFTQEALGQPGQPPTTVGYVAIAGGDHCLDCFAKANEIVAWLEAAISEVERLVDTHLAEILYGVNKGIVTFAFTKAGANVSTVLNAIIAAFGNSNIPIIVSWTTSSGQVMYMCIGKASACQALGDLARQIACVQQGQSPNCNAQEINWRNKQWSALPPSEGKSPAMALTP
ncbi:MAG: hypothetical protein QXQ53_07095 [Candidatus Methanosuratincola sp.]